MVIKLNETPVKMPDGTMAVGIELGAWRYFLALVLLFLSAMMVSTVKYPTFKSLGLRSTSTFFKAILTALFLGVILVFREKILYYLLPAFFTLYLIYGFIRPRISRRMRHEIEEEDDEEEEFLQK
jgi:CDP-diacylglycerol---serine O-phosphatidyltransferase